MAKAMKAMTAMKAMKAAMKAMKAMKAATVMKAMAKKKKSVVGRKASVLHGTKERTAGGLKKSDLMQKASGKIVSKKASAAKVKAHKSGKSWTSACVKARKELKITGFVPF